MVFDFFDLIKEALCLKRYCILLAAFLLLAGCQKQETAGQAVTTVTNAGAVAVNPMVTVADPVTAIEKIYEKVEIEDITEADARDLSRIFSIDTGLLESSFVRYTSGKFGLADTFILKPKDPADIPKLREQLEQVKLSIAKECEHFDIYNSYDIAQNGQIFEQGGYLILLMMDEAIGARPTIDLYIPKN